MGIYLFIVQCALALSFAEKQAFAGEAQSLSTNEKIVNSLPQSLRANVQVENIAETKSATSLGKESKNSYEANITDIYNPRRNENVRMSLSQEAEDEDISIAKAKQDLLDCRSK